MQDAETYQIFEEVISFLFFNSVYGQIVMESWTLNLNNSLDRGGYRIPDIGDPNKPFPLYVGGYILEGSSSVSCLTRTFQSGSRGSRESSRESSRERSR